MSLECAVFFVEMRFYRIPPYRRDTVVQWQLDYYLERTHSKTLSMFTSSWLPLPEDPTMRLLANDLAKKMRILQVICRGHTGLHPPSP